MQLSGGQLTSPVEGWGEDLHRLLEEQAAFTGHADSEESRDADGSSRKEDPDSMRGSPSISPGNSRLNSRGSSFANRVSRILPARSTGDQFPPIASAFDIYVEPDLPAPPAVYREKLHARNPEPQSHVEPALMSGITRDTEQLADQNAAAPVHRLENANPLPDSFSVSSIARGDPQSSYARDDPGMELSSRIHPATSMGSISSDATGELRSFSQPSGSAYEESIRSLQFTPPASNAHSPPLSPKPPTLNTHYTRPVASGPLRMQTPLVEMGPSWDDMEMPASPPKPSTSPYRGSGGTQSSSSPVVSPSSRRRTHSYYALAEARSDRILNLAANPLSDSGVRNAGLTSIRDPPLIDRDAGSSELPASLILPATREIPAPTGFTIENDDTAISAFAPRTQSITQTESYYAYHILPEDHTDRIRHSTEHNTSPARRKPIPKSPPRPRQSVTDTFKEAVLNTSSHHDSLHELDTPPTRPRHLSESSRGSYYSDIDALPAPHHRAPSFGGDLPLPPRSADENYGVSDPRAAAPERPLSTESKPRLYSPIAKEMIDSAHSEQRPAMGFENPPVASEPRSQLEMIRQRNMERKRGKRNQLRIVNM